MSVILAPDLDEAVAAVIRATNKVRDEYGLLLLPAATRHGIEQMARRSVLYLLTEAHGAPVHEIPHETLRRDGKGVWR